MNFFSFQISSTGPLFFLVLTLGGGLHAQNSPILSTTQTRPAPVIPSRSSNPSPTPQSNFTPAVPAPSQEPNTSNTPTGNDSIAAFLSITNMDSLENTRKLNAGDRLNYRVVEDRDEPKELFVTDTGEIDVPYLGRRSAEGKTCKELALFLKSELEKDLYFQANVIISLGNIGSSRGKIYVTGYVRGAGEQDIPPNVIYTVSKAILRAGGFGDFADQRKVKVHRRQVGKDGKLKPIEDTEPIIVDVKEILEKGRVDKDIVLQPDDYIFVPQKLINL
jgi:protein involved in polysaccharide export with SLBB domain